MKEIRSTERTKVLIIDDPYKKPTKEQLDKSLEWYNLIFKDRQKRGVEGTNQR